jgi:NAD(P)-dependent dehydrogenase (short-subunit alcohol dehydrogenase family)
MKTKVILITGASSGIGLSAARMLAQKGHKVYGAARRVELIDELRPLGVVPLKLDLTDAESVQAAVDAVLAAEGRVDVLVNNAGYGSLGPVETVSMEEARRQMEVNLFGLATLVKQVLPHMREQGSGRIINVSSIAGKVVVPMGAWYNVSKFSVEAFSDALRMEMKPFGVDVSIIEPSGLLTPWGEIAAAHLEESTRGTAYETAGAGEARVLRKGYSIKLLSGPDVVARSICRASLSRRPRVRYRPGRGARLIIFFHAILPARWWDALARGFMALKV